MGEFTEGVGPTVPPARPWGVHPAPDRSSSPAQLGPPVVRVLDPSPNPQRRAGEIIPPRGGRDAVTLPRPPGRGRGLRTATPQRTAPPRRVDGQRGAGGVPAQPPWVILAWTGMTLVDARKRRPREWLRQVGTLPSHAKVGIIDDRPLSRLRLRRLARRWNLLVERELILAPSVDAPVAVLEDTEWAVRRYWRTVPASSARQTFGASGLISVLPISLVRALPWSWTGLMSPHRILLARLR
jgi:hypothetical protein